MSPGVRYHPSPAACPAFTFPLVSWSPQDRFLTADLGAAGWPWGLAGARCAQWPCRRAISKGCHFTRSFSPDGKSEFALFVWI